MASVSMGTAAGSFEGTAAAAALLADATALVVAAAAAVASTAVGPSAEAPAEGSMFWAAGCKEAEAAATRAAVGLF